jgi:hypothetical protein
MLRARQGAPPSDSSVYTSRIGTRSNWAAQPQRGDMFIVMPTVKKRFQAPAGRHVRPGKRRPSYLPRARVRAEHAAPLGLETALAIGRAINMSPRWGWAEPERHKLQPFLSRFV